MFTEKKLKRNFASEANESRRKRGAKDVEEVDQENTTKQKKEKLDRDLFLSRQCFEVLSSIRKHRFGWRFDGLVMCNPDYFSVISKPMDLVTIEYKLAKNLYRNPAEEFPEDVRLVLANAMQYYPPESSVHKNAKELQKIFEIRWESVMKKLSYEFSDTEVDRLKRRRLETSEQSSSRSFYLTEKGSRSDQDSKGFVVPMPVCPEKALHAATIKIRFADAIVKAKYRKLIDENSNKADVMMRIQKEKQLLERRQREEKSRIEALIKAPRLKLRQQIRLSLEKMEEEAKSKFDNHLKTEKELVNLCGGSSMARIRWVEWFGLFLKSDADCLEETERKASDDLEEGEII